MKKNKIKIQNGILKNTSIEYKTLYDTRPSKNIIKNILISKIKTIKKKYILDLFSGSGNIGFECYSIKSKKIIMIDINKNLQKIIIKIKENICKNKKIKIISKDSEIWLNYFNILNISVIILDPPYKYKNYNIILRKINKIIFTKKTLLILLELNKKTLIKNIPKNIFILKKKYIGKTKILILKKILYV